MQSNITIPPPFADPILTVDALRNHGLDRVLSRADVSKRKAIFFVQRPSGVLTMVVAERDYTSGELTRILGTSSFRKGGLCGLERAIGEARRAVEALPGATQ